MPVTVNSTRLQKRLRDAIRYIPVAAEVAIYAGAYKVLNEVAIAVQARWSGHEQIGFDIQNFLDIIVKIEEIPSGGIGILNVEKMGTAEDFERIRGPRRLWHQGTRNAERFGLFINQQGMFFDQVAELAELRNAYWGNREPQWWLLEYGTLGSGAYNPQPPNQAITETVLNSIPAVFSTIEDAATRMLRSRGVVV